MSVQNREKVIATSVQGELIMNEENTEMITLEGELTLPRAEEIKKIYLQSLKRRKNVSIVFGAITDVDLSFLQLCCSLHRSALCDKKQVKIKGSVPMALMNAAEAAGYLSLAGCKQYCHQSCLWLTARSE